MLQIRNLDVNYGAISAVRGINLDVAAGEIVALIGANGAGKTTIARAIAGLLPYQGEIIYAGSTLKPNNAEGNVRRGISLVPEGRGILARMSVRENLAMGLYTRTDGKQAAIDLENIQGRFPILIERGNTMAGLLSGGEQQMLAIARALLSKPKLLLLDEPSLGLAPKMADFMFEMVLKLHDEGLTVLLIEQKARQALKIADRAYLMETGKIVNHGLASDVLEDESLSRAFLGAGAAVGSVP
jgi:branched-chain amino acid transport system ATP-binding protein